MWNPERRAYGADDQRGSVAVASRVRPRHTAALASPLNSRVADPGAVSRVRGRTKSLTRRTVATDLEAPALGSERVQACPTQSEKLNPGCAVAQGRVACGGVSYINPGVRQK